jgi:hypothetical protein
MKTTDIAVVVGKARETVSRHIAGLPGYEDEMAERARWALERRREYQRGWDREHRARYVPDADAASLRREHELAAIELSREQYYG